MSSTFICPCCGVVLTVDEDGNLSSSFCMPDEDVDPSEFGFEFGVEGGEK